MGLLAKCLERGGWVKSKVPHLLCDVLYLCSQKVLGPEGTGVLLLCGSTNWDSAGRKSAPKGAKNSGPNLWTPHRFLPFANIRVRLVASGPTAAHSIIITEDGKAYSFGNFTFLFLLFYSNFN